MQTIDEVKAHCQLVGNETEKSMAYLRFGIVAISIAFCSLVIGCDSRDRDMLSRKVSSLNEDVMRISERVECREQEINENCAKMAKFDRRLFLAEMVLRRLDGENDNRPSGADRVTLALKRIEAIEDRLEKLEKGDVNQSTSEVSADQHAKLVRAHNELFKEVEELSDKVEKLEDYISSPVGDVRVSPLSWLVDLKRKVNDLEHDVSRLKYNSSNY